MTSRTTRNRRTFRLESLEIRNAPSHIGGLAHVAMAVHKAHVAAHVRRFSDWWRTTRSPPWTRARAPTQPGLERRDEQQRPQRHRHEPERPEQRRSTWPS